MLYISVYLPYVEGRIFSYLEDDCNFFHLFLLWSRLYIIIGGLVVDQSF